MRVLEGIHLITLSFVNCFLVERGGELILVDTGVEGSSKQIFNYIESLGYKLGDVSLIVITHKHGDHTGALKEVLGETDAKVAAHKLEADGIIEKAGIENIDILLEDNQVIGDLRVIHTLGHTPGHICLLDEKTGALFVGDLVHEENGELHEIPQYYSEDPEGNREAIKSLLDIDFLHVLPSHGKPILNNGKNALRELVERLS